MEDNKDKQIIQRVFATSLSGIQEDPWMAQHILNTVHQKHKVGGIHVKKKVSVGLILFVMLMMSSLVALACGHSYVIQFLFGRNSESTEAQEMASQVQAIDYVQRSGAAVCTVKDAYFDGETLAIGLGFKSDRHIYLVTDEMKVNGSQVDWAEYGGNVEEMWVGNTPPTVEKDADESVHGMYCVFNNPLSKGETAEVTLRISLLAPKKGVQPVDVYRDDKPAMWAEIDAIYDQGLTPIDADEPYEVLVSSDYWVGAVDLTSSPLSKPYCDVNALVHYANMEIVDILEVTFTLNAQGC